MTQSSPSDRPLIERLSPNFDDRRAPISMIVLHYTGMRDGPSAIDWMASAESNVSAHYVVAEDGQVTLMVPEEQRAWHAGLAHWRGISDVNSASVGIEIVNPGHEFGYVPFPDEQIAAVIDLVGQIKGRYGIGRGDIVGHSDVAPMRKKDPGELFPWEALASRRLALPRPRKKLMDPMWSDAGFVLALERFGYDVTDSFAAVVAFQRRFRPELIDGTIDGECRAILLALLLPRPEPHYDPIP
ncbi:N-acetylmuramoyl-L-alanine amidase [Sphingorhabdus soli]|uniref:N-acetylmuramoyl-L-alanine amidase n=1 Tax=Flavisphingopyxis soli TaxID=2601267 RepID=A0A5C6UA10_9SPHN|nr:N-acetylmuramoyl-L-alanine amidase [Sphingorhabdus soli]TXC69011.1 N-acetylmuramoyl-L-alanine amidase [Sphingorhabdus soli]